MMLHSFNGHNVTTDCFYINQHYDVWSICDSETRRGKNAIAR